MEFAPSQLHMFKSQYLGGLFLKKIQHRFLNLTRLPKSTRNAEGFENVIIELPYLQLWGTPDNLQTRDRLAQLIANHLHDRILLRSITELGSEGIRIDAFPMGSMYRLIVSIGFIRERNPNVS